MKNKLTLEDIADRHRKNKTIVITCVPLVVSLHTKREGFKNVSNPESILRRRNAANIDTVTYMGEPYDFSKHKKLYNKKTDDTETKI